MTDENLTERIELTITAKYLPKWGTWEGVREIIQNARDAEVEFGARMLISHEGDVLTVKNFGSSISREALLMGMTSKENRSDLVGQFGEGLKLGLLALVRAGHKVTLKTWMETWHPAIGRSEKFNADVLMLDVESVGDTSAEEAVSVHIDGISAEQWAEFQARFIFLTKPEIVEVPGRGAVLLDPEQRGRVYCKGFYVQYVEDLGFGYDLYDAELDRDRKMVETWSLEYETSQLTMRAADKHQAVFEAFYMGLDKGARDCSPAYPASAPQGVKRKAIQQFRTAHGEDAYPVRDIGDSKELSHLGVKGVVVSDSMADLLSSETGTIENLKSNLRRMVTKRYGWDDLSEVEQSNLLKGMKLLELIGEEYGLDRIEVCEFKDGKTWGQFIQEGGRPGRIRLAKDRLLVLSETVRTLVHEAAHAYGGDHAEMSEQLWQNAFAVMLERAPSILDS